MVNVDTFWFIGFGYVGFSSIGSQFAEQGGHISGDLCIEGWQNQARPCSSPCRSKLFCFMSASNKLLHLLSHHQGTNSDNIHFYKPSTNHPRILGSLLAWIVDTQLHVLFLEYSIFCWHMFPLLLATSREGGERTKGYLAGYPWEKQNYFGWTEGNYLIHELLESNIWRDAPPPQLVFSLLQIDYSIMGGLVIEFGQKVFDMSIRTRAKQMEAFLRQPLEF